MYSKILNPLSVQEEVEHSFNNNIPIQSIIPCNKFIQR